MLTPKGSGGALGDTPLSDPNLKVISGSVTDFETVKKVFDSADDITGVVVALGEYKSQLFIRLHFLVTRNSYLFLGFLYAGGKTKDVGPTMLTDGTRNIVEAMKARNIKRVAVVTSIGAGDSEKQAPMMFKALMYTVMKGIFADKNNQERLFTEPDGVGNALEWCIVRPGGLGEGPPTGIINVIDGQAGSIQRADVAAFCLGAVQDESFPYIKKTPCISSVGGTGWVKEPKKGFDGVNTA